MPTTARPLHTKTDSPPASRSRPPQPPAQLPHPRRLKNRGTNLAKSLTGTVNPLESLNSTNVPCVGHPLSLT